MARTHRIGEVELTLAHEDELALQWIGADNVREQLLASWMVLREEDVPLNPRIVGKPGVGKTTLAYSVAKELERPVYIVQCTMDTRPEDLIVTPVLTQGGRIAYHASGLATAMIVGGVCILDEGNRMGEKSWASLAPLLDARRYVESIVAGIKIHAHPQFRVCATMNDDASTFDIPEYIQTRLKPQIHVEFPTRDEEIRILQFQVPFAEDKLVQYVADFLQKAHGRNLPFTSRDGIHILRYALKLSALRKEPPEGFLAEAVEAVLGRDGADFLDSGEPTSRLKGAMRELSEDEQALSDYLEALEDEAEEDDDAFSEEDESFGADEDGEEPPRR